MKVLISGSSGLIGREVENSLAEQGHQVIVLKRKATSSEMAYWDIEKGIIELGIHREIDIVIHLAGESIAQGRWNKEKKERIINSRVKGTKLLSEYFSKTSYRPRVFVSASAIGFYGSRGEEELSEESPKGTGFLSDVCFQWEEATSKVSLAGIRVANVRFGMVLSSKGGALHKMLLPFKMGFGGIIGDGRQYISWITIDDVVGIINHVINTEELIGPINVVSPTPATNYQFTKALGKVLNRPTVFPLPAFLAKMVFGEMAQELLLSSTKVSPNKLQEYNYSFKHATLKKALKDILTR